MGSSGYWATGKRWEWVHGDFIQQLGFWPGMSSGGGPWATPLKNMKVSWDCDIPNIWENKLMFQTTTRVFFVMGVPQFIQSTSIETHGDDWGSAMSGNPAFVRTGNHGFSTSRTSFAPAIFRVTKKNDDLADLDRFSRYGRAIHLLCGCGWVGKRFHNAINLHMWG